MVGNRYDNFYGYTGLFPIRPSDGDGSSPARDLRRMLSDMENGPGSMFSRTGLVHGARLFVLADVVYNGHPSPLEHLKYQYLVLSITFDGELETLVDRVAEHSMAEWDAVFRHCWGYPDTPSAETLLSHVKACQVTTTFLYVDAGADLDETLFALAAQRELFAMVQEGQGLDTAARRKLVNATVGRLRTMTATVPGSFTSGDRSGT